MAILILFFIIAMYLQNDIGLADQGDFTRSMEAITSAPSGFSTNFPDASNEEWERRFYYYWIPNWELGLRLTKPTSSSSTNILWLSGVLLNYLFYSDKVLYLPFISIFQKFIFLGVLFLLFKWVKFAAGFEKILLFSFGIPLILMLTTTDYVAYLNTFYLESGAFAYLFLFISSILFLKHRPSFIFLIWAFISLFLLASTKPAYFYWALVAVPVILYTWLHKKENKELKLPVVAVIGLVLMAIISYASTWLTNAGLIEVNYYHSFFYGVLAFSDAPSTRLQELNINNADNCVNTSAYSSVGDKCLAEHRNQITRQNTFKVLFREPLIMFRMMKYAFDNMQDLSLEYLGKYAINDPRSKISNDPASRVWASALNRFWQPATENLPLNIWSRLKFYFFPTGYALAFALFIFTSWFMLKLKETGVQWDMGLIGLMSTIACVTDTTIAIFGDGKHELIKHLFLANALFDIAIIIFINSLLISCLEFVKNKRQRM